MLLSIMLVLNQLYVHTVHENVGGFLWDSGGLRQGDNKEERCCMIFCYSACVQLMHRILHWEKVLPYHDTNGAISRSRHAAEGTIILHDGILINSFNNTCMRVFALAECVAHTIGIHIAGYILQDIWWPVKKYSSIWWEFLNLLPLNRALSSSNKLCMHIQATAAPKSIYHQNA